jgi:hypothetical protein
VLGALWWILCGGVQLWCPGFVVEVVGGSATSHSGAGSFALVVIVRWVVLSRLVSGCAWYLIASPAEAGDMSGSEGVGERVGGEGGQSRCTVQVSPLSGSPLLCSSPPVVVLHTSHPWFEGRRVLVVVLLLVSWGSVKTHKVTGLYVASLFVYI